MLLIFGPQLWVRYVLWKHSADIDRMPGTGVELAEHLIERFKLEGVTVVKAGPGENYYSPDEKIVALSPDNYDGKSITAVAVATHEVSHAIQFCNQEPITRLRVKYMDRANKIKKIGSAMLLSIPIITIVTKAPALAVILGIATVITLLSSVFMYVAILPEEFDASFKKALPILKEGYLPEQHLESANSVLKACALTYAAGALVDLLRLWRWGRFLR